MNQSLFALVALVGAMIFSFAQQRTVVESELRRVDHLYESRSARHGVRILDRLARLPFDPAGTVEDTEDLTLDVEVSAETELRDLKTLNDAAVLQEEPIVRADSLGLVFSVDVHYVEPSAEGAFEQTAGPTFFKEVTVTVSPEGTSQTGAVTMSRVFTYVPEP